MSFERRICDLTKTSIAPNDKGAIQLTLAKLNEEGRLTDDVEIIDVCGRIRKEGKCDELLNEFLVKKSQ